MFSRSPIALAVACALLPVTVLAQQTAVPTDGDKSLPSVTVKSDSERADGPVHGFAAKRSATATKTDTPLIETPQAISVVTRDQFEAQGALNLRDVTGYSAGVANSYYDSRGDSFKFRGTDPVQYLDGLQRGISFYNIARPDPYTLERVELLRGPSSVLYGQGSVGGVLNLVSKRPQAEASREVALQLGNYDRRQIALDMTGLLDTEGQWLYRLVAIGRDSGTQVNYVPDDRFVLAPSLTWAPSKDTSLTLQYLRQVDKSGSLIGFFPHQGTLLPSLYGQIPTSTFTGEPGFDRYNTAQTSIGWLFSHRFNDTLTVRQNFRASDSDVDYRTAYTSFAANAATGRPARPVFNADQRTVNRDISITLNGLKVRVLDNQAEAKFTTGTVSHTVLGGIDFQEYETTQRTARGLAPALDLYNPVYGNYTAPTVFTVTPKVKQRQLGAYAQEQAKWDRWVGVFGLRHDSAKSDTEGRPLVAVDDSATTYRAGVVYLADNGIAPYASYSESFLPLGGVDFFGVPYKPQRGKQFELGVRWEPVGGRSSLLAAIYELRDTNRKTTDPSNPLNSLQIGEVTAKGVEIEGRFSPYGGWNATVAYSFTDARVSQSTGADQGKRLASVPEHNASAWLSNRFTVPGVGGAFTLGGGVRYIGDSWDGLDALRTPSATLLDLLLAWDSGPIRFALNVNNATDKVQITTCLARGDCFYGQRRTIVGSLRYAF